MPLRLRRYQRRCREFLDLLWQRCFHGQPHHIKSVSLRFQVADYETEFVQGKAVALAATTGQVGILLMFVSFLAITLYMSYSGPAPDAALQVLAPLSTFGLTLGVVMYAQIRWDYLSPQALEALVALLNLVAIPVTLMSFDFVCREEVLWPLHDPFLAQRRQAVWMVLIMLLLLTISHLVTPVRWCLTWPAELIMVPATVWQGSWDAWTADDCGPVLVLLALMVVMSTMGKRSTEWYEREAFHGRIAERALRHHLESEMSQTRHSSRDEPGMSSEKSGVQSSVDSGYLFDDPDKNRLKVTLDNLRAIGHREHWLIELDDITVNPQHILGEGAFGKVLGGTFRSSPVAIKTARPGKHSFDHERLSALLNELRVLRHLRHPNIVVFHGALLDSARGELGIVLELVEGTQLRDFAQNAGVTDMDRYNVLFSICRTLQYLHGHRPAIVHGDLKPSNILVEQLIVGADGCRSFARAKLLDFGLSRLAQRSARPMGGTLAWMAPEVVRRRSQFQPKLGTAADVFSFGRLAHFIVTGQLPFEGLNRKKLMALLKRGTVPRLDWPQDSWLVNSCRGFAEACTSLSPSIRPAISTIASSLEALQYESNRSPREDQIPWVWAMKTLQQDQDQLSCGSGDDMNASPTTPSTGRRTPLPFIQEHPEEEDGNGMDIETRAVSPSAADEEEKQEELERLLRTFKRTPTQTQAGMVFTLLERWHCGIPGVDGCCFYHVGLRALLDLTRRLISKNCIETFEPKLHLQCSRCFAFLHIEEAPSGQFQECDICGNRIDLTTQCQSEYADSPYTSTGHCGHAQCNDAECLLADHADALREKTDGRIRATL